MLIHTVEEFIKNYYLCIVAQKASLVKKIIPHCDGKLIDYIIRGCEFLQMKTTDYHTISLVTLPHIKLYIKLHEQITSSLANGSPDTEQVYNYIMSGMFEELVHINNIIKLQEVAPNIVQRYGHRNHYG